MLKNEALIAYWFTFPKQLHGPMGIGVTAFSVDDARALMEKLGYRFHLDEVTEVKILTSTKELDQLNIVPNMGPIIFRGVWYPSYNTGIGASGQ